MNYRFVLVNSDKYDSARRHVPGSLESQKFEFRRPSYLNYLDQLKGMDYEFEDFLHYFPCFVGDMTLSRMLSLYEAYKLTLGVSGHIADVGMFKGASSFFFSKLANIFEPNSLVQVHGFDWFNGNQPASSEAKIKFGAGKESETRLTKLRDLQGLDNILKIHNLDLTKDLARFFETHPHLTFKLIFMDAGMYEVVSNSLPYFWERLSKSGIIIFDQYNFDVAPGETKAVNEFFKPLDVEIKTFPFTWMPTAYIQK